MRLVLGLFIISLLSGSSVAQDNPSQLEKARNDVNSIAQIKSEISNMLFAPLLKDRAWAAYNAGRLG